MKKTIFLFGILFLIGFGSCDFNSKESTIMSRSFLATGWERFDYITTELEIKKPNTLNLNMIASFDDSYTFDYFSVVFTVFDEEDQPMRAKSYKFTVKDKDGQWKSELIDGCYTFKFPINSELTLNEPGTYKLEIENRMPITPLVGIKHISMVSD